MTATGMGSGCSVAGDYLGVRFDDGATIARPVPEDLKIILTPRTLAIVRYVAEDSDWRAHLSHYADFSLPLYYIAIGYRTKLSGFQNGVATHA